MELSYNRRNTPKSLLNFEQALAKARNYCTYRERCQQEVRETLSTFNVNANYIEDIISQLINDNFLNEERFAKMFAGGKFRIKKWGRVKIKLELKKRNISEYCIKQALKEIDEQSYLQTLKKIIEVKYRSAKLVNPVKRNYLLSRFAISKGFESDIVWDILKGYRDFL